MVVSITVRRVCCRCFCESMFSGSDGGVVVVVVDFRWLALARLEYTLHRSRIRISKANNVEELTYANFQSVKFSKRTEL